jgi:hypothetical protein
MEFRPKLFNLVVLKQIWFSLDFIILTLVKEKGSNSLYTSNELPQAQQVQYVIGLNNSADLGRGSSTAVNELILIHKSSILQGSFDYFFTMD